MSNNTILKALERIGYKGRMTGHGFRGLASTALYERQFASDHIELQLAHVRGKVRGAYDHSRQLPQRTFVRTSELIEARWAEIDFDAAE